MNQRAVVSKKSHLMSHIRLEKNITPTRVSFVNSALSREFGQGQTMETLARVVLNNTSYFGFCVCVLCPHPPAGAKA